ncbi:hypothetical protein, conserved [Eimeria necatrix]|uniref:Uncharacterized protein n=1 Tax=Eimeria necatrix TaxID=51315 RepID=U6N3P9_9EIME|nr:hypothetical protein, conserved [Eimeria necatrix]CDJ69939.1 hypothetical protein, conserved [Eimeria necatrix]
MENEFNTTSEQHLTAETSIAPSRPNRAHANDDSPGEAFKTPSRMTPSHRSSTLRNLSRVVPTFDALASGSSCLSGACSPTESPDTEATILESFGRLTPDGPLILNAHATSNAHSPESPPCSAGHAGDPVAESPGVEAEASSMPPPPETASSGPLASAVADQDVVFALDDLRVHLPRSLLASERLRESFLARLVRVTEDLTEREVQEPEGVGALGALKPRTTACGAIRLEPREAEGFAALVSHLKGENPLNLSGPAFVLQTLVQMLADSTYWCIPCGPVYLPLFLWCSEAWVDELNGVYAVHPNERGALGPLPWGERSTTCFRRLSRLPTVPEPLKPYVKHTNADTPAETAGEIRGPEAAARPRGGLTEATSRVPWQLTRGRDDDSSDAFGWQQHLKKWQESPGGPAASDLDPTALIKGAQAGAAAAVAAASAVAATAAAAASTGWIAAVRKMGIVAASPRAQVSPTDELYAAQKSPATENIQAAAASSPPLSLERSASRLRPPQLHQQQQPQPFQKPQASSGFARSPIRRLREVFQADKSSPGSGSPHAISATAAGGGCQDCPPPLRGHASERLFLEGQVEGLADGLSAVEYFSCAPFHLAVDRHQGKLLLAVDGCRYPHIQHAAQFSEMPLKAPTAFRVDELQWLLMLNACDYLDIQLSGVPWTSVEKQKRANGFDNCETDNSDTELEDTERSAAVTTASRAASRGLLRPCGVAADSPTSKQVSQSETANQRELSSTVAAASGAAVPSATDEQAASNRTGSVVGAEDIAAAAAAAAAWKGSPANQRQLQLQRARIPPHRILCCRLKTCSSFQGLHMVCVHPYGHVVVPSWPFTSAASRSSAFQSSIVAVSSGLFTRAVQFYPWGIFALFADAPASRVFNSSGIAHGLSLVIGKAMVFGQTPRDIAEKRVQLYIHQTQQPYAPPLKPPDLSSIHDVIKVCPFVPPKELQAYKTEHGVNSDQIPMREYHRMLRLAVSVCGKLVGVISEGDFTLGVSRSCCTQPQPLIPTPDITSPTYEIVPSGFPNPKEGLFSSQLIGYFDIQSGKYYKCPVGHGYWILGE